MNSSAPKICPRCQKPFECRADAIHLCQCSTVMLDQQDRDYISARYEDCLCGDCLRDIQKLDLPQQKD